MTDLLIITGLLVLILAATWLFISIVDKLTYFLGYRAGYKQGQLDAFKDEA